MTPAENEVARLRQVIERNERDLRAVLKCLDNVLYRVDVKPDPRLSIIRDDLANSCSLLLAALSVHVQATPGCEHRSGYVCSGCEDARCWFCDALVSRKGEIKTIGGKWCLVCHADGTMARDNGINGIRRPGCPHITIPHPHDMRCLSCHVLRCSICEGKDFVGGSQCKPCRDSVVLHDGGMHPPSIAQLYGFDSMHMRAVDEHTLELIVSLKRPGRDELVRVRILPAMFLMSRYPISTFWDLLDGIAERMGIPVPPRGDRAYLFDKIPPGVMRP